jgi:hypothetical protein
LIVTYLLPQLEENILIWAPPVRRNQMVEQLNCRQRTREMILYMINGVTAVPIMAFMMLMASNRNTAGTLSLPFHLKAIG